MKVQITVISCQLKQKWWYVTSPSFTGSDSATDTHWSVSGQTVITLALTAAAAVHCLYLSRTPHSAPRPMQSAPCFLFGPCVSHRAPGTGPSIEVGRAENFVPPGAENTNGRRNKKMALKGIWKRKAIMTNNEFNVIYWTMRIQSESF